jgi:hypothetical protein
MLPLIYPPPLASNPSQAVRQNGIRDSVCRAIDEAPAGVLKDKFDYIWLINAPPFGQRLVSGLQPVWRWPGTILYRIPPNRRGLTNGNPALPVMDN